MKTRVLLALILSCMIFFMYSCTDKKADCALIMQSIVKNNEQALKNEINKLCASLNPKLGGGDAYGQQKNFTTLTERITDKCDIQISDICYTCVKTDPPISTFKLSFKIDTVAYSKTIEIGLTPYNRLTYKGIRD